MCMYIYIYVYVCIYIYIHIYQPNHSLRILNVCCLNKSFSLRILMNLQAHVAQISGTFVATDGGKGKMDLYPG